MLYDIIYNIMLHSNINTIKNTFNINKTFNQLYKNKSFWKEKLMKDNLLFDENLELSINTYTKIDSINNKVNDIVTKIKRNVIPLYFNKEDLSNIVPICLMRGIDLINIHIQTVIIYFNDYYHISYHFTNNSSSIDYRIIQIDKQEVKDILIKIFYYYPNILSYWLN